MIESRKILPLGKNAPVKYDLMLYVEMEALLSNKFTSNSAKAWYMTKYTQLYCLRADKIIANKGLFYKNVHISQPKNPFIKELITFAIFYRPLSMLKYVINQISRGRYIKILLDHFYLPEYKFYNKKHFYHTEFIYGYDLEKGVLYVIGSANLRMGGFKRTTISICDFLKSYESSRNTKLTKPITAIVIKEWKKYEFNFNEFYKGVFAYYNSKSSVINRLCAYNDKHSFFNKYGMNAYDELLKILKKDLCVLDKSALNLIKYLQAFADYKKLMLQRIEYLYENEFLNQSEFNNIYYDYMKVVDGFNIIIALYIKNSIFTTSQTQNKIIDKLEEVKKIEKNCLDNILSICRNIKIKS